jgi:hypothetical protein
MAFIPADRPGLAEASLDEKFAPMSEPARLVSFSQRARVIRVQRGSSSTSATGRGDYHDIQTGLDDQSAVADPARWDRAAELRRVRMTAWTLTQTDRSRV